MKNIKESVNEYINKNLDNEFNRIQDKTYLDILLTPTDESCIKEWLSLTNTDKNWTFSNIIKRFHPSMCLANRKHILCPWDGWENIKNDKTNDAKPVK